MDNQSPKGPTRRWQGLAILWLTIAAGCGKVGSDTVGLEGSDLTVRQSALTIGTWSTLKNATPTTATNLSTNLALELLTDGSVLLGDGASNWFKLRPDTTGSYQNGTWSSAASSNYFRTFTPSTMLPDGRYLIAGGEYVTGTSRQSVDIFDPVLDTWTEGPHDMPEYMGDTASSPLPGGKFYVSSGSGPDTFYFNPATLNWTAGPQIGTGGSGDEKGWTLLQDGSILDAWTTGSYYLNGVWTPTGPLPNVLVSAMSDEIGPMSLLHSGKAIQFGASDLPTVGNSAIYDPSSHTWTAGPVAPGGLQWGDTSAVVMVNDHVLTSTSAATNSTGTAPAIYEYDPSAVPPAPSFTTIFSPGSDPNGPAHLKFPIFLPLPNGQVLVADPGTPTAADPFFHLYTPAGVPTSSWRPTITSISSPTAGVYTLNGTQLNGLTNGSSFGDDRNSASAYPIVYLTDNGGHVYYARSFGFTTMAPSPGASSCQFSLPASLPNGNYNVWVSASGIASVNDVPLTVSGAHVTTLSGLTNVPPGSISVITVTLSASSTFGTTVTLASDNTSVATVPASVTVPPLLTSTTFPLTVHAFGIAHISASTAGSQFKPATLEFGWNVNSLFDTSTGPQGVGPEPSIGSIIPPGGSQVSWTVNISNVATSSSGVTVSLQSSDTRWAIVPATVSVPAGTSTASFTVSKGSEPFGGAATITATIGGGSKNNSINTLNSLDFPWLQGPLSLLM